MLRACDAYAATPVVRAALKQAPILLLQPGELRFAEWPEIDIDAALWTVPAIRMKRELREKLHGAPHLVPLPKQAITVLRDLHKLTGHATMVFRGETMSGDSALAGWVLALAQEAIANSPQRIRVINSRRRKDSGAGDKEPSPAHICEFLG